MAYGRIQTCNINLVILILVATLGVACDDSPQTVEPAAREQADSANESEFIPGDTEGGERPTADASPDERHRALTSTFHHMVDSVIGRSFDAWLGRVYDGESGTSGIGGIVKDIAPGKITLELTDVYWNVTRPMGSKSNSIEEGLEDSATRPGPLGANPRPGQSFTFRCLIAGRVKGKREAISKYRIVTGEKYRFVLFHGAISHPSQLRYAQRIEDQ